MLLLLYICIWTLTIIGVMENFKEDMILEKLFSSHISLSWNQAPIYVLEMFIKGTQYEPDYLNFFQIIQKNCRFSHNFLVFHACKGNSTGYWRKYKQPLLVNPTSWILRNVLERECASYICVCTCVSSLRNMCKGNILPIEVCVYYPIIALRYDFFKKIPIFAIMKRKFGP